MPLLGSPGAGAEVEAGSSGGAVSSSTGSTVAGAVAGGLMVVQLLAAIPIARIRVIIVATFISYLQTLPAYRGETLERVVRDLCM